MQRAISRPIHELAQVIARAAGYEKRIVRISRRGDDEFGSLAKAFNIMLTNPERQTLTFQESEERLRLITENIREVFWITNPDKTRMIYVSPGYEKAWGRTCESLYQSPRDWLEAIHPEDRGRVLEAALTKQVQGEFDEEYRIVRPDGSVRWIRDRAFPVRDETGSVFRIVGIAEDITQRRRAELAREALLLLGTQINAVSSPVEAARVILATADKLWEWHAATLNLYLPETDQVQEVLNCDFVEGQRREVPAYPARSAPSPLMRRILRGEPELILRQPPYKQAGDSVMFGDTSRCSASIMCVPLRRQGQPVGVLSLQSYNPNAYSHQDLVALQSLGDHCGAALERLRADVSLRESEARFRQFGEATFEGLAIIAEGKLLDGNAQLAAMLGYTLPEMIGRSVLDFIIPESRELVAGHIRTGYEAPCETLFLRRDGSVFPAESQARHAMWNGRQVRVTGIHDLTERKRAKAALRASEETFQKAFQSAPVLMTLSEIADGRYVAVNEHFCAVSGFSQEEALGNTSMGLGLLSAADRRRLVAEMETQGRVRDMELTLRRKDAGEFVCLCGAELVAVGGRTLLLSIASDITNRKHTEEALKTSQRDISKALEFNQRILNTSSVGILTYSAAGQCLSANEAAARMLGTNVAELLAQNFHQLQSWKESKLQVAALRALSTGMEQGEIEACLTTPLGKPVWLSVRFSSFHSAQDPHLLVFTLDISERKRAEQALLEAKQHLEAHMANSPLGVAEFDPDSRVVRWSGAAQKIFGWTHDEILGKTIYEIRWVHEEDIESVRQAGANMLAGRCASNLHVNRNYRKDGTVIHCEWHNSALFDGEGRLTSIFSLILDITERKKAEEAMQDSEDRFRTLFEASPLAIALHGPDGRILQTNQSYQSLLGYPAIELRQLGVERITHPADAAGVGRLYQELVDGTRDRFQREQRYCRKDGKVLWGVSTVSAIRFPEGRLRYVISVIEDVTMRRQAEIVTRELASIVENSADAIISQTGDGIIVSWNRSAERIYRYPAAEVMGRPLSLLLLPDQVPKLEHAIDRLREGSRVEEFETVCRRKDGALIEVAMTVSPVRNGQGEVTAASTIARDITERKRLEREIVRIGAEERRRISHELHDGLGQTLTGIAFKAKVLQGILGQAASPLAKDLGEIATLVSGAIAESRRLAQGLEPIQIETAGLIAALAGLAAETQHLFGLECIFRCAETDLSVPTSTGATLYRIAQEAIHNAVSHGSARSIEIELATRGAEQLRLCVKDDGKGFDAFEKEDSGMGLRIMQHRAHAIGGTLNILSQLGKGTRIECFLPLHPSMAGRPEPSSLLRGQTSPTKDLQQPGRHPKNRRPPVVQRKGPKRSPPDRENNLAR